MAFTPADRASQLTLQEENVQLRARISNLEEVLRAIHADEVDAMVSAGSQGGQIISRQNTDFVYRLLIEEMAQGALTLNAQGVVLYANRGFAQLLGRELNTVIGQDVTHFFAPEGRRYVLGLLQSDEPAKRSIEVDLSGFDGERTAVMLSVSPMTLDGLPDAFGMVVTDLTAKKRTETEIQAREVLLGLIEGQKRAQEDLRANQAALLMSVNEKEALLKEVHHRVKNNLQVIISLLRLESFRSTDAPTKSVLQDMQSRVRAMGLLHETIYRKGTFAAINLGSYIGQIASESLKSMQINSGAVCLRLDMETLQVGLDQATPAGMLISELISNSLKHAFPEGRTGEICISLHPLDTTGQWRLRVSDSGIGLPADFEERRKTSLGLQLAVDLATQMGGALHIGTGQQAVFTLDFKAEVLAPLKINLDGVKP